MVAFGTAREKNRTGEGKTALVTGGSRGIGRGIAYAMAEAGYNLALSHWNDHASAEAVKAEVRGRFGRKLFVFDGDLERETEPERLTESAVRALGRLDVLVNNAGVTLFDDIAAMETADINRLLHLDFRAPILLIQHVGRHMIERGIQGCMINITSTRVERVYPRVEVYGGVKAALARASQSAALELSAYGIRVNCIAPGAIAATKEREAHYLALGRKIRLGRPGRPVGQTANIHLDLASPNFGVQEWSEFSERMREVFPGCPEVRRGYVYVSGKPGWASIWTSGSPRSIRAMSGCPTGRWRASRT